MEKIQSTKILNLKWTWWLFLIANVLLVLAVAIAWGIYQSGAPVKGAMTTVIVCDTVALVLTIVFFYFDSKDLFLLAMHVPKKVFRIYFASGILFILIIIFTIIYSSLWNDILNATGLRSNATNAFSITFGIMFGVVAFASIVTISIYRYGRYRIDLTIFRRRHGEIIAQQESNNQDNLTKNDDGNDSKDDTTQLPTANLIDHVDKE